MAKRKTRRARATLDRDTIAPTEAQLANGEYIQTSMPDPDGGNRVAQVHINRGGSAVERWKAASKLDDRQQDVIGWMLGLWQIAGLQQRITANYGERIPGGGCSELAAAREIDARDALKRVSGYFPGRTSHYLDVFEDIVRHEMPAGEAGATTGFYGKSAQSRALTIVRFVCDVIGTHERI